MSVDRTIKPEALPQFPWPMPGPNERVALFTAPVELTVGDKRIPGQCEFAWSLTPHPCLECRVLVEESGKAIVTLRGFAELVVKDGTEVAFPVFVRAVRLVSGRPAEISAVVPQGLCIGDTDHAECLLFQIVNFGDFHCGSDYVCELPGGGWSRLGHIQLQCDNWAFEITQVLNAQKGIREAEASEGFAVTHVGCLSRPDSALFTFPEARAALHMLHHFLGFVCGRWCGPTIGVGQDAQGESISWHWSMYTVDSWRTRRTWFPGMHADVLKQLFPSFARMWGNRTWQDPLRYAVYWYLLANNLPNVEARVVLLQNALELLSWTYAVEDRQLLSSRGFKKLWASDEIRILLFSLDIPMAIPRPSPAGTGRVLLEAHGRTTCVHGCPQCHRPSRSEETRPVDRCQRRGAGVGIVVRGTGIAKTSGILRALP